MRFPHVINVNTREEYDPSIASRELALEVNRKIFSENLKWGDNEIPSLVTFCVKSIAKTFLDKPMLDELPNAEKDLLLEILPTDLPLQLVIPLINDEIYWKRKYIDKYKILRERLYPNWTWKSLFIERYMRDVLEEAQPQYKDEEDMTEITNLCCSYITHLTVTQLQDWRPPLTMLADEIPEVFPKNHISFEPILKQLNQIEELSITFGVNSVGLDFNWHMFQLSELDCKNIGIGILYLSNIKILKVRRAKLGDLHCQALMQGLIYNQTLTELDLSYCDIKDHGALCIAKVMLIHPTLQIINLACNNIQSVGTQGIGFALLQESCCPLVKLDLRLNPLRHDGVMGILRALVRGTNLLQLNLSACIFEEETPLRVSQMIKLNSSLQLLDVSSNWFGEEGGQVLLYCLMSNRSIKQLDIRETNIPKKYVNIIQKVLKRNRDGQENVMDEEKSNESEDSEEAEIECTATNAEQEETKEEPEEVIDS